MRRTAIRHNLIVLVLSKSPFPAWENCDHKVILYNADKVNYTVQTAQRVYDLPIRSDLVADTFASLPEQEQSILILRLVLDLTDSEIGEALGLSRSAVQRRRKKTLDELRNKLTALMPKGG